MRSPWRWEVSGQLEVSEPKDEPTRVVLEGLKPFLAWLLRQELIGRNAVVELDLESKTDAAAEQRQHRDPGSYRWGGPADLSVGPLG